MDKENQYINIDDPTRANAGRVYDYFLGGHHYFDVDKEMGDKIAQQAPFIPKLAKLTRWFLGKAIRIAIESGFNQFIDFASALPTANHIHLIAPEGTRIIYSDIDPITVDYGKEIIGENPIVKYIKCDASTPEMLLESAVAKELFGENHKFAFGLNGICWFLQDKDISHIAKKIYDFADEGSILFFTDYDCETISEEVRNIIKMYERMNQPGALRSRDKMKELLYPWKTEEPGLLHLEEWFGWKPTVTDEVINTWKAGGLYGGIMKKR
ncbi:MAG: SAM-dependent methyltransferase [Spirochaetales bacterium]|nr:SAM-dependent methyltransferase [Spirochaetales bacterium]